MRGVHITSALSQYGPLDVRGPGIASDSSKGFLGDGWCLHSGFRLKWRRAFNQAQQFQEALPASGYAGARARGIPIRP